MVGGCEMDFDPINGEPNGKLGIIALESAKELGDKIDYCLRKRRMSRFEGYEALESDLESTYLIDVDEVRFSNGEGKVVIKESVRGKDIYILCDIGNYSCTYDMFGFKNHKGPDEHFQDIKRVVSALNGRAKRVTVIMPLMYESRQHRRKHRESLDCALALQELERLGVRNIITFDVHDPNVQNSVPLLSFQNLYPTFEIVKAILNDNEEEFKQNPNMIVISPDTGAMDRSIYYASVLGVDVGLFYKRRDYSTIVDGSNPIVQHEYMGKCVEGMDVLITDDMIASGGSVFDIASELKARKANRIFVATTFALFTSGIETFEKYHNDGIIDKVYSTNLSYLPEKVLNADWFEAVDMSEFISSIVDRINFDKSLAPVIDATKNIKEIML